MWLWTTVGVAVELVFQVIPASLGLVQTIDAGLARTLCLMDAARHRLFLADPGLHRVLHDGAARGRRAPLQRHDGPPHLHSVLIYSLPVGMHHLLMDPQHGNAGSSSRCCSPPSCRCRRC